jgi:hypothetical protein
MKEDNQGANTFDDYNILGKSECPIYQTATSGFYSIKIVNISKWRSTLYILQVGPYRHVFQVTHMFLGQFGWISLKKQRSVIIETIKIDIWNA